MDEKIRDLLSKGREHYAAGEYAAAEPYLTEIANAKIDYADVFDMLGVIHHQRGDLREAEAMFQKAIRVNPNYTQAALNLAVTYNDLGKYQEAKDIYGRVIATSKGAPRQLDPFAKGKLANMHADLGAAYHQLGIYVDAVREYEKALALCPAFHDLRTQLGVTLRDMGNATAALREFERVRQENSRYLPARINLGLTYFTLGRRDEALAEWREILTTDPGNKSAQMYIAMVSAQSNDSP